MSCAFADDSRHKEGLPDDFLLTIQLARVSVIIIERMN